jgi:hypothetical protein
MPIERTGSGLCGRDEVLCGENKVADVDYDGVDVFDEYVNLNSHGSGRSKFPIRRTVRGAIRATSGSLPLNVPLMLREMKLPFKMTSATTFESI